MFALSAGPSEPEIPIDHAATIDCGAPSWVLDGAPSRSNETGGANFRPEWAPKLSAISRCLLSQPALENACVSVQGHSDPIAFEDAVVRVYGSVEAAQLARGRGRALSVLSKLYELGVPALRLRELPPSSSSSVRGVELTVLPNCLSAEGPPSKSAALDAASLESAIHRSLDERAEAERQARLEAARNSPHRFALLAGLDLTLLGFSPDAVFAPALDLGAEYRYRALFARGSVGLATAFSDAQRLGFQLRASGGYAFSPLLQVGVAVRHRTGAPSLDAPWLEQTLHFGVEASHCLTTLNLLGPTDVCVTEALLPVGFRFRRGAVDPSAGPVRISPVTDFSLRFDLGVTLRKPL